MTENKTSASMPDIPATADAQDPLPEQDWTWRRIYTYALTLVCCLGVGWSLYTLHDLEAGEAIYLLSKYMLAIIALLATYYMIAPSAEQIVHLIQAARLLQSGVSTTSRSTVRTPQGSAESVTTAGRAPVTPAAPVAPPEPATGEEQDYAPRSKP